MRWQLYRYRLLYTMLSKDANSALDKFWNAVGQKEGWEIKLCDLTRN
jgi:hypothetical protein